MRLPRSTGEKDVGIPKLAPARFPNLRMGTSHTEYWLREPRICRTRGCPERYVFRPVCRTCHQRTERM